MPIESKYDIKQQQQLLDEVLTVFTEQKIPADLALMTLGNAVSNVIQQTYAPGSQHKIAEQFGKVLLQSMDKNS